MKDIQITYDAMQHCIALKKSKEKTVAMDCPYTGKGEEFSPTNLVESALGGCMLISMGTYAIQHNIDLKGTKVNVQIYSNEKPNLRFSSIEIVFTMPEGISEKEGKRLERAAETCPIKHSFAKEISVNVKYLYPSLKMI